MCINWKNGKTKQKKHWMLCKSNFISKIYENWNGMFYLRNKYMGFPPHFGLLLSQNIEINRKTAVFVGQVYAYQHQQHTILQFQKLFI